MKVDNLTNVFSRVMHSSFKETRSTTDVDSSDHSALVVHSGTQGNHSGGGGNRGDCTRMDY